MNNQYKLGAPERILTEYDERLQREKNDSSYYVKCHCGKLCKGIHGLWTHQRFCTICDIRELRELFNEEIIANGWYFNDENFEEATFTPQAKLPKLGLKLSKATESWKQAKRVFQVNIRCQSRNRKREWKYLSLSRHCLRIFQKWIWNCFRKWHIRWILSKIRPLTKETT